MNRLFVSLLCFSILFITQAFAAQDDYQADQRIPYALTISGGVSLGAYESGTNWALLRYLKQNKINFNKNKDPVFFDLVAVTGASAGSINTLISAISWCADESKLKETALFQDNASENLFYKTWASVGLDNLLPDVKQNNTYDKSDGLLARAAFSKIIGTIKQVLNQKVFRSGCQIPFGLTVTSQESTDITVSGLTVQNQRYFIPMVLKVTQEGKAELRTRLVNRFDTNFGNILYLADEKVVKANNTDYVLSVEQVINAVLASSAFPVAFGRKVLKVCTYSEELASKGKQGSSHCPKFYQQISSVFLDGGVFDNIPLGATMALAEGDENYVRRRVNYIYIDPDRLRYPPREVEQLENVKQDDLQYDLASQLGFLSGSVTTARKYELFKVLSSKEWDSQLTSKLKYLQNSIQAAEIPAADKKEFTLELLDIQKNIYSYERDLQYSKKTRAQFVNQKNEIIERMLTSVKILLSRYGKQFREFQLPQFKATLVQLKDDVYADRKLFLSSRFPLIAGDYLAAFGGFFSKDFRDFDYYAGIYDAIIQISITTCQMRGEACKLDSMVDEVIDKIFDKADEKNADALFIIRLLRQHEAAQLAVIEKGIQEKNPEFSLSDSQKLHAVEVSKQSVSNEQLYAVACGLLGSGGLCNQELEKPKGFFDFLSNIKKYGYDASKTKNQEYLIYALKNNENWWRKPAYNASARLSKLEDLSSKAKGNPTLLKKPLEVVSDVGYALYYQKPVRYPWLPNEFGIGAGSSPLKRFYLAWNLYPVIPKIGLQVPFVSLHVTPYQRVNDKDKTAVGTIGVTFWPVEQRRFGIGPDLVFRWTSKTDEVYSQIGMGVNFQIKLDWFKLTAGLRSVKAYDVVSKDDRAYLNIAYLFE